MKKLLALSIMFCVIGAAVFAEVTFNLSGQADVDVIPFQLITHDEDTADNVSGVGHWSDYYVGAGLGRATSDTGFRFRLKADAAIDKTFGFRAQIDLNRKAGANGDGVSVSTGDFLDVWWQPLEMLKFDVGRFNDDTLRGKVGDDDWSAYTVAMGDKDSIFTRFKGNMGAELAITLPQIPALYIGILVPSFAPINKDDFWSDWDNAGWDVNGQASQRALRVYERTQVGAGFEIDGIGHARLQFVGENGSFSTPNWGNISQGIFPDLSTIGAVFNSGKAPRFELAFAYTGMEGLIVDFGVKFYVPIGDTVTNRWDTEKKEYYMTEEKGTYWKGLQFSLGGSYGALLGGALGINARVDFKVAGSYKNDDIDAELNQGINLNAHLWPTYKLQDSLTAGLDFGIEYQGATTGKMGSNDLEAKDTYDDYIKVGFGLWLEKTIGNASVRGGLAYAFGENKLSAEHAYQKYGALSVPIWFTYSF